MLNNVRVVFYFINLLKKKFIKEKNNAQNAENRTGGFLFYKFIKEKFYKRKKIRPKMLKNVQMVFSFIN